jgi:hypothetical protein
MPTEPKYWFPAKRYGWGWGPPLCWQGWTVLALFVILLGLDLFLFPPKRQAGSFLAGTLLLSAAMMAICWAKGEPPRWRWGGEGDDKSCARTAPDNEP